MEKFLFFLFLSGLVLPVLSQETDRAPHSCCEDIDSNRASIDIAKNFIYDLADLDIATDIVLSQHVLIKEADDEMYDYLLASLDEIRLNLMSKNVGDIQFIRYTDMPKREIRDIDTEEKDVENMFFLHYRKRQMSALYIENGRIASFTLVSKGNNKAHFVTY